MNIEWVINKAKEKFYPITHAKAVLFGDNNKTVEEEINNINATYIKSLSASGKTVTYTKGDGTTGTITTQDTTYSAGTGLALSGTTFNHSNSVTAGTAQGDANKTLSFGGTFTIPTVTYDAQGHVTGKGTTTMTMPAAPTSVSGNAATATKLATARTIALTGSVTGSGTFDGSGNLSIATTTNHTHNYASSSSAGGSATSAVKLDSSAGSATQPVYFSGGKPVACTYTLGKSVPSDAVFTDTNTWRPVTDDLTSTSTSNCLSANQGRVLKELIDGKAASDHTHSNYLENGDYISCENSIVSIDGDLYVSGIVRIGQSATGEESDVSCVKRITSGSKVTVTIPRNNLDHSTALLDDISIKCYVNGYGDTSVNIYNSGTTTVAASWDNSSLSSYCPTIGCSYTSTTATITLTATFSTTKFLVIRYCPGLTTITVS